MSFSDMGACFECQGKITISPFIKVIPEDLRYWIGKEERDLSAQRKRQSPIFRTHM